MKFSQMMNQLFLAPLDQEDGDIDSYIQALESGKFKNNLVYGISDYERGFLLYDPVDQPGALYCGGMGSGKSVAMRFTLATHIASNSENTIYLLMDPEKGMSDYQLLFDGKKMDFSENVAAAINDVTKIVPLIDMIFDETMQRKELFSAVGANKVYTYDDKINKILEDVIAKIGHNETDEEILNTEFGSYLSELEEKNKQLFYKVVDELKDCYRKKEKHPGIARVVVAIEEFHAIPYHKIVNFSMKSDVDGTIANKMKRLMRIGRSFGIFFLLATQKATASDVPGDLNPGLTMRHCFKMNTPHSANAMNLPHAMDITAKQRGRAAYEQGFVQYPFLDDKPVEVLMKKYYKPLKASLLKYQMKDYHTAFAGEGNSGMVDVKSLGDLIKFSNQFDVKDILKRILREFKIETEEQLNTAYEADLVGYKYDKKYAIKIHQNTSDGSEKQIAALKKGAEILNCDYILFLGLELRNSNVRGLDNKETQFVLDKEDLNQMANIIDNKTVLERENEFAELYLQFPIASKKDLGIEEDIIENNEKKNDIEDNSETSDLNETKKEVKEVSEDLNKKQEEFLNKKEKKKEDSEKNEITKEVTSTGKVILDYNELQAQNKNHLYYVSQEKIVIKNMPSDVAQEFKNHRKKYKETGILPKVSDPLIDEIFEKRDKTKEANSNRGDINKSKDLEDKEDIKKFNQIEDVVIKEEKVEEISKPVVAKGLQKKKKKKVKEEIIPLKEEKVLNLKAVEERQKKDQEHQEIKDELRSSITKDALKKIRDEIKADILKRN